MNFDQIRSALVTRFHGWQEADAEDACQHALQKLVENPDWQAQDFNCLITLLYVVGRNRLLNETKKQSRRRCDIDLTLIPERSIEPEHERKVRHAIRKLPKLQRDVIARVYISGQTNEEVAAAVKRPLSTVKTQRRRGLLRLRTILIPSLRHGSNGA